MNCRFLCPSQSLQNTSLTTFPKDGALIRIFKILLQMRVHARILCYLLIGLFPVPQSLFQTTVQHSQLVSTALLMLFDGSLMLGLQFLQLGTETGRKLLQLFSMVLLFLTETLFEHRDVLLKGLDFQLQDALLVP